MKVKHFYTSGYKPDLESKINDWLATDCRISIVSISYDSIRDSATTTRWSALILYKIDSPN